MDKLYRTIKTPKGLKGSIPLKELKRSIIKVMNKDEQASKYGWKNIKNVQPTIGLVVEVYIPDKKYSHIKIRTASLMKFWDDFRGKLLKEYKIQWVTTSQSCEDEWSKEGFKIKYWRYLRPSPDGYDMHMYHSKNERIYFKRKKSSI